MGKLNVVLSGIYYPVAIVRYFQSALLRRSDVNLFTVGPYTGTSIPWANGMFVDCPLPKPDLVIAGSSNHALEVSQLESLLPWVPDVWIQVDAAFHLKGRPTHGRHFTVGTDPHCVDYDYMRGTSDVFFNMQTPYMKEGDVWLPYAYDPAFHYPRDVEKAYDFGIIGADNRQGPLYNNRTMLVQALRSRGYVVLQIFGKAYSDYRDLLTLCKVGLNWSTREDTVARVFETMAMNVALMTNWTPDLEKVGFISDDSLVTFRSMENAILSAEVLMNDDVLVNGSQKKWQRIACNGFKAVKEHTYDARVEEILSHV